MPAGAPPSDAGPSDPARPANAAQRPRGADYMLGGLLILVGIAFLAGQVFHVDVGHYGWPLFVIVPGVLLFASSLVARNEGLAVAGGIVTMTGLLLAYQNTTDHWASWAYAWALVAPGSVGVGLILYGAFAGRPALVRQGRGAAVAGLVMFLVGAAFFEGVINISGGRFGRGTSVAFAALLIALGLILLISNLMSSPRGESRL